MIRAMVAILLASTAGWGQWTASVSGSALAKAEMDGKLAYQTGTGAPSALACTVGKDVYVSTSTGDVYWCTGTGTPGTWTLKGTVSGTAPIAVSSSTGAISCQVASGSQAGCLAAADWTTFAGKQAALGFTPLNAASNLSDLANAGTARTNLGLATVASSGSASDLGAGTLPAARLPAPGASTLGGVRATDCTSVGVVQKVNSDGTIGCVAGGTSRTWTWFWQGAVQYGNTAFAVYLPATGAPTLTNSGGTRPIAVLQWPAAQSTYYAWWTFVLPAGYLTNAAISYRLESRSADATNYANAYLGLACSSTTLDNPTITEATAVQITAAASSAATVTTGTLTPNAGGLPACQAGQRVWVNLRVDANVASHVMASAFDLTSAQFAVAGGA